MNIDIENRQSYIFIKISGQVSLNISVWRRIEAIAGEVAETVKRDRIYKILFNCCDLSGQVTTIDRFLLASFLVKENLKFVVARAPALKMAMVLNPALRDADKFGEKVARNRGLHGLVTENLQEAMDWLGVKEIEKVSPAAGLSPSAQPSPSA